MFRLNAVKSVVPKSPVPGMNTKIVGRVAPVEPVKQTVTKMAAERAPVEKVAAEKRTNGQCESEKNAGLKEMMGEGCSQAFVNSAMGGLGGMAMIGAANLATNAINKYISKAEVQRALDKAISINPRLKQRNRAELEGYLNIISEASPSIARNPLLLANYLDYLIDHQGLINFTAYSDLAQLEGKLLSNRAAANPLTGQIQKAIVESTIRGAFDSYGAAEKKQIANREHQRGAEAVMKRYNIQE